MKKYIGTLLRNLSITWANGSNIGTFIYFPFLSGTFPGTEISSAKVELDGALPEPKFLVPLPHEAMVRAGQKLKLQCEVEHLDSSDDTRVTWLYNGKPVTDNSRDVKVSMVF